MDPTCSLFVELELASKGALMRWMLKKVFVFKRIPPTRAFIASQFQFHILHEMYTLINQVSF